ncbi:MAG: hypothetical protein ACLPSY_00780 [Steroidobacteraceae bacterium]
MKAIDPSHLVADDEPLAAGMTRVSGCFEPRVGLRQIGRQFQIHR